MLNFSNDTGIIEKNEIPWLYAVRIKQGRIQMTGKTVQEIIDNITVMDDTFFHKLVEDKGFCEELLQVVLGNPNIRLIEATAQKSLRNIRGRSVVLDAHCVDISDKHFDLEMQRKDDDDHQKRVRYNSSNMDTYIAEKGTKFEQIPDIYVIYITKNDFFLRRPDNIPCRPYPA